MSLDIATLGVEVRSTGIREANDGLNRFSQTAEKAERRATSLTASIEKLSNVFQQNLVVAQAFSSAMSTMTNISIRVNDSTNATTKALSQLSVEQKRDIEMFNLRAKAYADAHAEALKMNAAYDQSANAARKSAQAIMSHTGAMQDAHAAARGLSGSLGALWVTYGSMIPLAAGLAIGTGFKQIVSVGKDVEHTLESIRVKGNESIESVNQMRLAITELGKGIYGPQEVAKAFETLILAGKSAEESLIGIHAALNLATVGGTTIEKSAYTLVQVSTSLGMTANGFDHVADTIAATAAASMSSVESISEAFKSGSVVGKLYGVTLTDIGVAFAALSNLGIQGSAAGTSLKNFYKELASEGKKVTQTFKDVGITVNEDLKDKEGNFKSLSEILPILSDGLSKLTASEQKVALNRLANERGLKTLVELLDMYRQKSGEAASEFEDLQSKIAESAGMTAIGAAAMALTVENQFKSVSNTLKTSLMQSFDGIAPKLSMIATHMKATFNSPEFISGVQSISMALAEMAVWVTKNIDTITTLVQVFLTFKTVSFVAGLIVGIGEGLVALKTAFDVAKISAISFQASLGLLGAALLAVGAAVTYFMTKKSEIGKSAEAQASLNYINDFTKSLDEEATRLDKQIELMKKGKNASDAYTESLRARQLEMIKAQGAEYVSQKQKDLDKLKAELSPSELRSLDRAHQIGAPSIQLLSNVNAVLKAERDLVQAQNDSTKAYGEAEKKAEAVRKKAKELADLSEKQARDNSKVAAGTGVLSQLGNNPGAAARANDLYEAELKRIQDQVNEAKHELKNVESKNDALFKTGQIGRLEQIQRNGEAAIAMYRKEAQAYQNMIDVAAPKNKETVKASIGNKLKDAQRSASDEALRMKEQESIRFAEVEKFTTEHLVKELEARGEFVKANALKFGQLEKVSLGNLDSDISTTEQKVTNAFNNMGTDGGNAFETLTQKLNSLKAARDAFTAESKAKEDVALFNTGSFKFKAEFREMENSINTINLAAKAGGDWESKFNAAGLANSIRANALPALQEMSDKLMATAKSSGNEQLIAQAEKIKGQVQQTALSFDTMWDDAAKGADDFASSLESSFGTAVGAVGKLTSAFVKQQATQEKIENARKAGLILAGKDQAKIDAVNMKAIKDGEKAELSSYANMAGAAKNFFNEKSKGYQVLQAVEQGFRAMQLAGEIELFMKKMFFTQATTAAVVSGNTEQATSAVTSAGTEVGAKMAVAQANAVSGVSNQANGDPYSAFFRMAAMAAIMAGLGLMVGGRGGGGASVDIAKQRQATQGTGTVLGAEDKKSESITKSLELLKSNSDIALSYTSSMVNYLKSINDGIAGMSAAISRTSMLRGTDADQRALGVGSSKSFLGFSSSSKELVDSGIVFERELVSPLKDALEHWETAVWTPQTIGRILDTNNIFARGYSDVHSEKSSFFGLSKSSSNQQILTDLPPELRDQFVKTISNTYQSILTSASALGENSSVIKDAVRAVNLDQAGIFKVSLKGLSGEEVQKQLESVFGALGDKMAEAAMPSIAQFSKVGEGAFQTLIRVANGVDTAQYALEKLNITAVNYTGIANKQGDVETEIIRDSIVAHETYTRAANDADKQIMKMVSNLTGADFNNATVNVSNGIADIISTMDGSAQDLIDTYKQLVSIRDLMNSAGLNGGALSRSTIRGAGGLDSLKSGVETFFDKFYTDSEKAAAQTKILSREFDAMNLTMPKTRDEFKALVQRMDDGSDEGEKLVGKLLSLSSAFADVTESAESATKALAQSAETFLVSELDSSFEGLQRSVEAQKKTVTDSYEAQIKAVKDKAQADVALQKKALDAATESQKAISSIFDSLKNAMKSTQVESAALTAARRREAQGTLDSAMRFAGSGGDLTKFQGLDDALQVIAKPAEQMFSTFQEYAADQARTANLIGGLTTAAGGQKDAAQLTIDAINATIDSINTTSDTQVAALESTRDAELGRLDGIVSKAQEQIDAIKGVDSSVKSVEAALQNFNLAVGNVNGNAYASSTGAISKAYQDSLHRNAEDAGLEHWKDKVAAGASVASVVDAIQNSNEAKVQQLYSSILGRVGEAAGVDFWTRKLDAGESLDSIKSAFMNSDEYKNKLPSFDVGTDYVPHDMVAQIHEGERIIPAADNAELMRRLKNSETQQSHADVVAAIAELKQCIISGDVANVQQTKEIVKYLKKFDTDGMPETRDVDA